MLPNLGNVQLDTVPVDYVAKAIKNSCLQQSSIGRVFHLCSGPDHSIKLTDLRQIVRRMMRKKGVSLPFLIPLPVFTFKNIIKWVTPLLNDKMQRIVKTFPFFLDYLSDNQAFDNQQATQFLGGGFEVDHLVVAISNYLENSI